TRGAVDLQHPVEVAEVDADHRPALPRRRLDAADDAGAAAVGDGDQPGVAGPGQKGGDVLLVARQRHPVRCGREVATVGADDVAVGLAVGVAGALVPVVGQELMERGRRLDPRRPEGDLLQGRRLVDGQLAAEARRQQRRQALLLLPREVELLVAPAPELAPSSQLCRKPPLYDGRTSLPPKTFYGWYLVAGLGVTTIVSYGISQYLF